MHSYIRSFFLICLCIGQPMLGFTISNLLYVRWPQQSHQEQPHVQQPCIAIIHFQNSIDFNAKTEALIEATKRNDVDGIMLIISSNGGSSSYFSVLHDTIKEAATQKPIIALITDRALSGGYMIASAAHYVMAHTLSDIGDIGAWSMVTKYIDPVHKDDVEAKMDVEFYAAGKFKAFWHEYSTMTEEQRTYWKEGIEQVYQIFVELVAHNRNLDASTHEIWANGQSFLAPEALELGLIDQIGTFFDAEKKIVEMLRTRNPETNFTDEIYCIEYK